MSSIKFLLLLLSLVATSTQGFLTKQVHSEENVNNDGTYLQNIKTIAQDIKDTLSLKKQMIADAISTVGNAKHNIITNVKDGKKKLVEDVLASQIAKVNAMKTAKEEFIKTIMGEKQPFFYFQTKLNKIKEAVPTLPPVEGLKSRLSNFFREFFDKFQGHFKKHKKFQNDAKDEPFVFTSHPSSNEFSQVQGIAAGTEYFPSGTLPVEATLPVTQTTDAPSEYVIQPAYEYVQTVDVHPGFQSSQFSSSSNYDQSKEDDIAQSEFSTVDFTDHQTNPHVRSPYYGSYSSSAKSIPNYGKLN